MENKNQTQNSQQNHNQEAKKTEFKDGHASDVKTQGMDSHNKTQNGQSFNNPEINKNDHKEGQKDERKAPGHQETGYRSADSQKENKDKEVSKTY